MTDEIDMGYPRSIGEELLISKELSEFKADGIVFTFLLKFCSRRQVLHKDGKIGIGGLPFIIIPPSFSEVVSHVYQCNQKGHKAADPQYVLFSSQVQIDGGKKDHETWAVNGFSMDSSCYIV